MNRSTALLLLPLLAGCLRDNALRPGLGACAGEGDGASPTYGEVPIGTCLAGPTDVQFVEREGRSWLAVSNADPFINFDGGSLLLIDWDDVLANLDRETLFMDELAADAIPTERFVAGFDVVPDRDLLVLTRRLTEDGRTRTGEDSAFVFDLDPFELWADGPSVGLKDDPGDVFVGEDGRAYALNFTDHSVSVVDVTSTPLIPIDLAPEASIAPGEAVDTDGSGSVAELDRLGIEVPEDVPDDAWDLTFLPGSVRAFAENGAGLDLWSSGGGAYARSAIDDYVPATPGTGPVEDPALGFVSLDETSQGGASILFATGGRVAITTNQGVGAAWSAASVVLPPGAVGAFDELKAGPSRTFVQGVLVVFYDGRSAATPDVGSIGRATSNDGVTFTTAPTPVLAPPAGMSYEQPFVQFDPRTSQTRMWLSIWDGVTWHVGHTASEDGAPFEAPELVASAPGGLAAPTVRYVDGRYVMWASTVFDGAWWHVELTSSDGFDWSAPTLLFASPIDFDPRNPPRAAVQAERGSAWRIAGLDNGQLGEPVIPGVQYIDGDHGVRFSVAAGHELSNDIVPDGRADAGLFPTSHVDLGGIDLLYVTTVGEDGRSRIALLDGLSDAWGLAAEDLIPRGSGGNVGGVSHAVVRQTPSGWVMVYSALDAELVSQLRFATSPDGTSWTPVGGPFLPDLTEWAGAAQEARTLELLPDGGARLWFAGSNGSRYRIGAVTTTSFDVTAPQASTWELAPGATTDWQLAPGLPGSVDDSGVKDPVVVGSEDALEMYYSAFDGLRWHLAHARRVDGEWVRRLDPVTDATRPAMSPVERTFSNGGVDNPVARLTADGTYEIWYAGTDLADPASGVKRLGKARSRDTFVFPTQRVPTLGDTLAFHTTRGDERVGVIELGQSVDAFLTLGVGTTSLIPDPDRGFLYVPSKLSNLLYIVDVRDDSRVGFVDENALDLEGLIRLPTVNGQSGYRGGALHAARERLYLTTTNPDGVLVVDTSQIEDDALKEVTDLPTLALLPLQDGFQDQGAPTVSRIGGAHPVIAGDLLLVPNFKENSVSVIDLGLGPFGTEIAHIPWVGENPHRITISPDGRFAVVANYLGNVSDDDQASSTLALIDLDPASPTWLQVVHRIANQ